MQRSGRGRPPILYGRQRHMAKAAIAPETSPDDQIFPEDEIFSPDSNEEEVGDELYEEQTNLVQQEEILPTAGMGKLNIQSSYNPYEVLEDPSASDGSEEY